MILTLLVSAALTWMAPYQRNWLLDAERSRGRSRGRKGKGEDGSGRVGEGVSHPSMRHCARCRSGIARPVAH